MGRETRIDGPVVDVVVIGAGIAGLAAANVLAKRRVRVLVVEADSRTGGRIHSVEPPGWPCSVEFGAEFVHARPPFFATALRRSGVSASDQEGKHVVARAGQIRRADRTWHAAFELVERLPDEDVSYAIAARQKRVHQGASPEVLRFAKAYVEGFNAAEAIQISSRALALQSRADRSYDGGRIERVTSRYGALTDWLAEPLLGRQGLQLGTRCEQVDWRGPDVIVECRQGYAEKAVRIRCKAAVITVPVSMLKDDHEAPLRFVPTLPPTKRDAIARIAMGSVSKVVLRLRARGPDGARTFPPPGPPAPPLRGVSFLHTPDATVPTWWLPRSIDKLTGTASKKSPPERPILIGWSAGPSAERFADQHGGDADRAVRSALNDLAKAIGAEPQSLLATVEDAFFVDWSTQPFAAGAYSWLPVGALQCPAALAAPVDGRLFFAGEATHTGHQMGTVHGAMETGLRAADEVAAKLRRA